MSFHTVVGMRDAVVYSIENGASFVPFVRTYITLPFTFAVGAFYLALQRRLGTVTTYSVINWGLVCYFLIYTLFLIPNHASLTLSAEQLQHLQVSYPHFQHVINLVANWPSALFHVTAEVWTVYIFIILFWQVANEATTKEEAQLFYPVIIFLMSFGTTFASYPLSYIATSNNPGMALLSVVVPLSILLSMLVFYIDKRWGLEQCKSPSEIKKPQLSIKERLLGIFERRISSRVLFVSVCVMSFNLIMSLFDSCFWTRISQFTSSQNEVLAFYSQYTFLKGCTSLLAGMINIYLIDKLGWYFVIRITPVVCGISIHAMLFSYFPGNTVQLPDTVMFLNYSIGVPVLITWLFALGLLCSYACKFAFFDPAKEILIKSMPSEDRRVTKVFADGFSGRAGKITGGVIQSILLSLTAAQSILEIAPIIFVVSAFALLIYCFSIYRLRPRKVADPAPVHASG